MPVTVKDFGAVGDGIQDDTAAIQRAFDAGEREITIPAGDYRIAGTLRVPSHRRITADAQARIFSCGETPKKRGDFLLTNQDFEAGNEDITIVGGIWDGNNQGRCNTKNPDLFAPDAWSGTVLNFYNVRHLKLEQLVIANSVVYNTRFCKVDDFELRDIGFFSEKRAFNQDGLHFGGFVTNGIVENIRAISDGQTNDDLLALNADDSLARLENYDLVCGPIENITFRNIYAANCHTAIRMLSVNSPIRNIKIENLDAGCRCYTLNMDAARYCRTPLFRDEDHPQGVGCVENIDIHHLTTHATANSDQPLFCIENNVRNFHITGLKRDMVQDVASHRPLFRARNLTNFRFEARQGGRTVAAARLDAKSDTLTFDAPCDELKFQ